MTFKILVLICAAFLLQGQTTQPRVVSPSQINTVSGTGRTMVTTTGSATAGDSVVIDAHGNHVDSGTPAGGGGGGFPSTVASVVDIGVTTSRSYTNLASAPTDDGLYVLTPYWLPTTIDPATFYSFVVNWTDQNGVQGGNPGDGLQSAQYPISLLANSIYVMHPVAGSSITGFWTQVPTAMLTISVSPGQGGAGYAPGDIGFVTIQLQAVPLFPGQYEVLTVDGSGSVLTVGVHLQGAGFQITNNVTTSVLTGNGDGNLQVDITALAPMLGVFSYYATLQRLH